MGERVEFAVIGDVHGRLDRLQRVLQRLSAAGADGERAPDGVLVVGDLDAQLFLADGRTAQQEARHRGAAREVLDRVRELGVPVLWVPGNHDLPDLAGEGQIDGRVAEIAGVRVAGIGGGGPARFGFSYEWDDDELRGRPALPCDVLLCHAPPLDTPLDLTSFGTHAGSAALRERALAHDGALVCGHIHEAGGAVQLGRCLCLNAGALGAPHGRTVVGRLSFDPARAGGWQAALEDLDAGTVQRWRREDP